MAVIIANTGKRDGTEVAQRYVRDEVASVTRPVKQLAGFQRVTLKARESRRVTFATSALGFWDAAMHRTVEPGRFKVFVGPSSAEGGEGRFEVR